MRSTQTILILISITILIILMYRLSNSSTTVQTQKQQLSLMHMPLIDCVDNGYPQCDCSTLKMKPGRICIGSVHNDVQLCYRVRMGDKPSDNLVKSRGNMLCDDEVCRGTRALCKDQPSCKSFGEKCGAKFIANL